MSLFYEINTENKLRITITYLAMSTLREDEADFGLGLSTLVNRIISYFVPEANASVLVQISRYENRLKEVLGKDAKNVLEKLVAAEEKVLVDSIPTYADTSESFLFRITNNNMFLLTQDPTTREDKYYQKGIKAYVEALVEEFVRRPFVERERLYCSEVYQALETAMKTETAAFIFHTSGKKYLMRVFEITTDSLSTHSYVIARLIDKSNEKMNNRIYTFRLSRIEKVLAKPGISGAFTEDERKKTACAVSQAGAQFLGDRIARVVVEFTDEGLKQFASQMHLRPHVSKIHEDGHTYEFECTSTQALFYFRRLGPTAKVMRPAFLTRELAKWYLDAAEHYKQEK